jgi:hypothetical protein
LASSRRCALRNRCRSQLRSTILIAAADAAHALESEVLTAGLRVRQICLLCAASVGAAQAPPEASPRRSRGRRLRLAACPASETEIRAAMQTQASSRCRQKQQRAQAVLARAAAQDLRARRRARCAANARGAPRRPPREPCHTAHGSATCPNGDAGQARLRRPYTSQRCGARRSGGQLRRCARMLGGGPALPQRCGTRARGEGGRRPFISAAEAPTRLAFPQPCSNLPRFVTV